MSKYSSLDFKLELGRMRKNSSLGFKQELVRMNSYSSLGFKHLNISEKYWEDEKIILFVRCPTSTIL